MNPDEAKLALWLDDELEGEELTAFESREVTPERLAAREGVRAWRRTLAVAVPAAEEPPYADFFNSRIQRSIREGSLPLAMAEAARPKSFWLSWLFPAVACAGMAFTFWIGKTSAIGADQVASSAADDEINAPLVYTPDGDVDAEWFASSSASATVIVLEGVSAIPDSMDFSASAYVPTIRESDSTAGRGGFSRPVTR